MRPITFFCSSHPNGPGGVLSRGNLRQKDWKEVADAVNGRQNGVKPRRTDIQCKNRIDTLKKKYKLEKSKPPPSKWLFYSHLDHLIGTNAMAAANKKITYHMPTAVTFTVKACKEKLNPNPNPNYNAVYSGGSTESSRGGGGDERDEDMAFDGGVRKQRMDSMNSSDGTTFRELARAILKLGEVYERIESSKQQQMLELERERMKFTKDLEFQRMHMFMEAQLEIEKMKRPNYASGTGANFFLFFWTVNHDCINRNIGKEQSMFADREEVIDGNGMNTLHILEREDNSEISFESRLDILIS
ncbi:hypothetical protein HHK36_018821 [Tetracentron sinense]|uniref:Myb/SANT-like DNA-binding domain-containing protein n=1 Tax=Tetracentron sinense TaxID=13715 RepID=A0A834YSR1_TETSI|nr:hypothetical protein HHK36_018821 [Tetracentron sinense]